MRINFTPGPSQLYFTVPDHLKQALREGIPSISHRSKQFESIYKETTDGLRTLLGIPSGHSIFFTGSATEIWERVLQNLAEKHTTHLVNGAFSKRFYETATQLNKHPHKIEVAEGSGFTDNLIIPQESELLAVTQNETSTGVATNLESIYTWKESHDDVLVAVDAVSSLPYADINYSKVDSVFFSVQKGFGLPAGLGVWIVNEKCLARASALERRGISTGSYHNLSSFQSHAIKNQTPETPNVLYIYLLGKVINDMLARGIVNIRRETNYKATLLYQLLDQHTLLKPFVKDHSVRSKTVIVAECGTQIETITQRLKEKGMQPGDGYGAHKKTQLRFANFPTHSKEQFELLVDTLSVIGQ
jgi:phosphoserine aminotransferase